MRGFGFVTPEDGGRDVYVHRTQVLNARFLRPGQRVTFEVIGYDAGRRTAFDVWILK